METAVPQHVVLNVLNFTSQNVADAFSRDITDLGYRHKVRCGHEWLRRSADRGRARPHVVLINGDRSLRSGAGELAERLAPSPWICVLEGQRAAMAQGLMRAATEFLQAPWSREELAVRLERFVARMQSGRPGRRPGPLGGEIVGSSPAFCRTLTAARRAASCAAPVVIEGETGTGKELIARLVHGLSDRSRRAFVPVNCGCLPPDLVENELFGHEAGAYTGATTARAGVVQQADGGTLFLDEVDALSARAQVALLRFLQQGEIRPVGGGRASRVDVRILAAANRPLAALVDSGAMREDLYFRLNVLEVVLPPLRERPDDVPLLARHFLNRHGPTYGLRGLTLSDAAADWLLSHRWPGNVRQLENLMHRAVLAAEGPVIEVDDLRPADGAPRSPLPALDAAADPRQPFAEAKARALHAFERRYLLALMQAAGGNVTAAAARAGKERRALGRLLKKHGLAGRQFRSGLS